MSREFPNSFKDPLYAELDARTEQKLGLPPGLLSAIRLRGERSNNDQVSEAQARSPYQFIPATRKAIEEKYGIDPLLSPQNASEAAGLLLKESLARNGGDAALAVAEYHGGTDRKNWGPRTRAYVQRVVGRPIEESVTATVDLPSTAPKSTFTRVAEQRAATQPDTQALSKVFAAYKEGRMSAQQAAEFEKDVRDGLLMLPQGMTLKGAPSRQAANMLPVSVITAYQQGRMSPQQKAELEQDVASGIVALPEGMTLTQTGISSAGMIPGAAPGDVAPAATQPVVTAPQSIGQQIVGAGETALALGTGATGGVLGGAAGLVGGLAGQILQGNLGTPEGANAVEQSMMRGMQAGTYAPRTEAGQQQMQAIGGALQNLPPVVGVAMAPGAVQPALAAVAPAGQAAATAARAGRQAVAQGAQRVTDRIRAIRGTPTDDELAQRGSVGAAGTEAAAQRIATAESLPVPVELTRGAAQRDSAQLEFEKETMKSAEFGGPLRARAEKNNLQILQNFERMVDASGAEAPDISATGRSITGALAQSAARDKAEIRTLYKRAEKEGELSAPVPTDTMVQYLNENISGESTAPTLQVAKNELVRLGGATRNEDGTLTAGVLPLNQLEQVRKAINKFVKDDANDQRVAAELRTAHDLMTEGVGGDAYRAARAARIRYADKYENRAIVANLLTNRRGMKDPKVAIDQVFNKTVLQGSPEELKFIRGVLEQAGPQGEQALRELRGATVQHIKNTATAGLGMDSADNPIVSPAQLNRVIKQLDKNGRLDIVLGPKDAQTLRDVNDVVQYVSTVPPGTLVNTSGTSGMILSAIGEAGTLGMLVGMPVPALTAMKFAADKMRDRKIQQRVEQALRAKEQPQKAKPKNLF